MSEDIRWKQRFDNFKRAMKQLEEPLELMEQRELSRLEKQGTIQAFEYNYELAWNTLKDYFEYQGLADIYGSRDAFRLAFERGLISEGEIWMDMVKKRQLTVHTYNEETSEEVLNAIVEDYFYQLNELVKTLQQLIDSEVE